MNRLAAAHSTYLRQHAGNPVDWWEWGADAFAAPRALELRDALPRTALGKVRRRDLAAG